MAYTVAPSASATPPPVGGDATPPTKPLGVSGTANYGGDLYSESNAKLTYQAAYGQAGSREWGEWEALLRTDSAVAAGLDFVCGPIRDARVDVEPVDDSEQAAAIADLVRWNLTEALEPTFPELLTQAVKGFLGVGFAVFEPSFKETAHPLLPGGRGYVVDKVSQRLPSTFAFNAWREDESGELRTVRQQGPGPGGKWVTVDLPAERLLLFTWQRNGNNYQGFSAFRAVWYAAQIRKELLRLVGVTYQREGAGVPVMESTDRAAELTPDQRTQLERVLANLVYHENASLIPPAGWSLKWTFAAGANKGHVLDAWHRLGVTILEQVQAQQLALGTGDTGSRSVGEVHDSSARAFISSVVAVLEGVLNGTGSRPYTGLVRRLVDANFGPQAAYPRLRLTLKQAQLSPKELLEAVTQGVAAKALTITAADENALREKLGLSPIDEADREAELARRAALAPAVPDKTPPPESGAAVSASLRASVSRAEWTPWRPLRASEKVLDLQALDTYLASRPEVFEQSVRPVVVEMLVKAAPAINAAMADGAVTPQEVAAISLDSKRLDAVLRAYLADVRAEGGHAVKRELRKGAVAEVERGVLQAAGTDDEDADIIDEADAVIDAQQDALKRRMVQRLRGEVEREAIDTMRTGGDATEVVNRAVARQLDTGAFRADAGSVTTKAFNVGRDEAARIMGGIASVEYSAILDSGTCSPCREMDGRTALFDSPEHDAMLPPNRDCEGGDRCRCLLVMIPGGDE